MNNATYVFDQLALIFEEGKWPNCLLLDGDINALCLHFREVFVLWDGTFLLARTIYPDDVDISTYRAYVTAVVEGHTDLKCSITPKVHLMLKHVEWQMKNVRGGWEIKWRIGLSACIKTGCVNGSNFAQSRTPRSVQRQERRCTNKIHVLM